ncbi:MAG: hypothetical protein UU34_C0024G0010 [Candidatus Curtissbacteria bacterium GW2011_GWA1_41_11]|uniref:Transglutaminase-like domain-containing protein n=1 Tax=Candidatus Curtissbacteria bacterium GW2011_GWA1_41_11 TaxID=1618409 RepID=A0A0G0XE18_9BACT|nr:MAG: hypothetical protein UU34_C0024G0010 [Candidatus Curtissbacteria bacterium GW2011_GWA1_41_11]
MRLLARAFFCLFLSFLIFVLLLLTLPTTASADGEFQTDYDVNYKVDEKGHTEIIQTITLENKTANYYADRFELKIGSIKVEGVKAQDGTGAIEPQVKFEENVSTIALKLNERVIGLGKKVTINLSYSSAELVTKSGQIWEISIPRLAKSPDLYNYSAQITVPRSFGPVAFTIPEPKTQSETSKTQIFTFDKDQLTASGISISFGQNQVFKFTLNYFLENSNLTAATGEITLPPDNNYQKIVLSKIEPEPENIIVDEDGNFIAKYKLAPKKQINITARGYVEVFSKPFRNIDTKLTDGEKEKYLQPQSYWETDSAQIKEKAQDLKTPEEIYKFVVDYLKYSDSRLNLAKIDRLGALAAMNDPNSAVCMEFTDLFIALSRTAGIPAKEIVGYAYTQNTRLRPLSFAAQGDLLHAWPAYWDDELGWVQVDPTWGSTSGGLDFFNKMDFNHVTLAQRGLSSTLPYPAGSFKKQQDENKKTVDITFADQLPYKTSTPELSLSAPQFAISGIPIKLEAQVKNIGSTSFIDQTLTLESPGFEIKSPNPIPVKILPPYSKLQKTYLLKSPKLFEERIDTAILGFAEAQISKPIFVKPFFRFFISSTAILSLIITIGLVATSFLIYKKFLARTKRR